MLAVQGEMTPLLGGETAQLSTDLSGQFVVSHPAPARFKFSTGYSASRCRDAVTGADITFPMVQEVPATDAATITAISLLVGPAKEDAEAMKRATEGAPAAAADKALVPAGLWKHVYGLYGLDADALGVDFLSFTGDALRISSPRAAQVLGNIAQTMSTYMSGHGLLGGLFGSQVRRAAV